MMTRTSPSKSSTLTVAAAVIFCIGGVGAAAAQPIPNTENGHYSLSPVAGGVIRLDTRTGAAATCSITGMGWACDAAPDGRAARDVGIGQPPAETEKTKAH